MALAAVLLIGCAGRAAAVVRALQGGDERLLLGFPLSVICPAVLVILLFLMPPARTREGLLMRIGAIVQLLLIILIPSLSLYLALGLPVVFLAVEMFERHVPLAIRAFVTKIVVA